MNNYYNPNLLEYARELRNYGVIKGERRIWKALLSRKKLGYTCKRQRPIDRFIVDFFIAELQLIIEIDGSSHVHKSEYDYYRQRKLEKLGFTVVRFEEGMVMQRLGEVKDQLDRTLEVLRTRMMEQGA